MTEVRVRMAPSPTGYLHIGGLRTALYDFLLARQNNGKFIIRIEDTDQSRFVPGSLENIVETFADFKLHPDEGMYWDNGVKEKGELGPYLQSKRLETYKKYTQELLDKKAAYYCFCSKERLEQLRNEQSAAKQAPKYDKHCLKLTPEEISQKLSANENHVVRLNVPAGKKISFTDMVHGLIEVSSNDLDDQVLLKSDGFPTYHLAVVVDDYLMKISHVIRGDEWIPSTPKHILLYEAFGWPLPKFVHLPLLLSKTHKKLSKRDGDVSVKEFVENGYLPEALINFVAFLGWNPKTEQEKFSLTELVEQFSLDKINKSGAVFDLDKLDWINGVYIRDLKPEDLFARIVPFLVKANIPYDKYPKQFTEKVLALEQGRLKKLSEIGDRVRYFYEDPVYDGSILVWKKSDKDSILKSLNALQVFLQSLTPDQFKKETLETEIKKFIETNGLKTGEVLWPLRVALSGLDASPGPFEIMDAFGVLPNGKEIVLSRVSKGLEKLF
jgi:nondiscriminating glutamyl-tRNA synthetase